MKIEGKNENSVPRALYLVVLKEGEARRRAGLFRDYSTAERAARARNCPFSIQMVHVE